MRVASPIPKKRARIEIIPLIDIMFFLLASFMMVSLSQTHMKGIKANLPAPGPATNPNDSRDTVRIKISPGNTITVDNQLINNDDLLNYLGQRKKANPNLKVSISAELMAVHGDVITVLDKVRLAGIEKVGYQIRAAPAR